MTIRHGTRFRRGISSTRISRPTASRSLTLDQQGELVQWAGPISNRYSGPEIGENVFHPASPRMADIWRPIGRTGRSRFGILLNGFYGINSPTAPGIVWSRDIGPGMFVPGGRKLITWSRTTVCSTYGIFPSGVEEQSWLAPASGNSFALSPDGRQCVAYGWEGTSCFETLIDRSQRRLNLDTLEPDVAIYSPDGTLFAVASSLGFGRFGIPRPGSRWRPWAAFSKGHTPAFSADGRRVAVGAAIKRP